MNGKTTEDEVLNPCSARMDRKTYGCRWANILFAGKRWVRIGLFGVYLDLYPCQSVDIKRWFYSRIYNAGTLFFPLGSLTWPMPAKLRKEHM